MNGLLSAYMETFPEKIEWDVVGTDLYFNNGIITTGKVITQAEKYLIVNELLKRNNKVVFLADDSTEDMRLFNIVKENNGLAFVVKHNAISNESNWKKLYSLLCSKKNIINYLKHKSEIQISNLNLDGNFYTDHSNEIGILTLSKSEYQSFYGKLDEVLKNYVKMLVYKKGGKYFLRGNMYYFWLPPYINMNFESKFIGWKKLYYSSYEIIKYICTKKTENNKSIYLVKYMICEHLLAALYFAIYYMEEQQLRKRNIDESNYICVKEAIVILNKLMYMVIHENDSEIYWGKLLIMLNKISIDELKMIDSNNKFLLELDNYQTIFSTVHNIVNQMGKNICKLDAIVCFAYGGIALGYAFQATVQILFKKYINIYTSHYSSKRSNHESDFIKQIPNIGSKQRLEDENIILLLDNNVTTFMTMKTAKKFLKSHNKNVYCAVSEIDYDNIANWLLGEKKHEIMCQNWYEVLDFMPVNSYVKAYNTWGTSTKSIILENIFSKNITLSELGANSRQNICSLHRKICRVHNLYDLQMALKMGASMIGIHAVISDKTKYYENEKFYGNTEKKYPDLPVPDYEVEGIRYMVSHLPDSILPVLVIEKELAIKDIQKILDLYGLDKDRTGIQLQFFVTLEYIDLLLHMNFLFIIVAVGVMEKDIANYLNKIDSYLRKKMILF